MELKKASKQDLDQRRSTFVLVGLVISLGIAVSAFEYRTNSDYVNSLGTLTISDFAEDLIPTIRQKDPVSIPKPKPVITQITNIVDNNTKIDEPIEVASSEGVGSVEMPVLNNIEEEIEELVEFWKLESKPSFPGGEQELINYISQNIKYPEEAVKNEVQGIVYVRFVISKSGKVSEIEIHRGVNPDLDNEALRVVKMLPDWIPGMQANKPVKCSNIIPIKFLLK